MTGRRPAGCTLDEWRPWMTGQARAGRRPDPDLLDEQQRSGVGDMDPQDFRAQHTPPSTSWRTTWRGREAGRDAAVEPGTLRSLFPAEAPESPEPIEAILADYQRLIEPNITHWQHPRFLAYFSSAASGPGIIGEMLTAVLIRT